MWTEENCITLAEYIRTDLDRTIDDVYDVSKKGRFIFGYIQPDGNEFAIYVDPEEEAWDYWTPFFAAMDDDPIVEQRRISDTLPNR